MISPCEDSNWVSIAEQLSVEMDEAKLAILVKRLCCALDARQKPATQEQINRDVEQIVAACPPATKAPLGTEFGHRGRTPWFAASRLRMK